MNLDLVTYKMLLKYTEIEDFAPAFAQNILLLPLTKQCQCDHGNKIEGWAFKGTIERVIFRCGRESCRKQISMVKGTWFENRHLSIATILKLTYFFVRDNQQHEEIHFKLHI